MLETTLLDLDNDSLKKEYEFYQTISSKSSNQEARNAYLQELEKLFDSADKNHDHRVQRNEFESLIITYFQMKNITPSKENFDKYFEQLDQDHEHYINFREFTEFSDSVIDNDILPMIQEEMQNRGLH